MGASNRYDYGEDHGEIGFWSAGIHSIINFILKKFVRKGDYIENLFRQSFF